MQDASVLAYLFEYEYSIEMRTLHDIFRIFLIATKSQKENGSLIQTLMIKQIVISIVF